MSRTGMGFLLTAPWLALLPPGIFFDTQDHVLDFQGGPDVVGTRTAISVAFGLTEPWKKYFNEDCKWWEYINVTANGFPIRLYGDTVGPKGCTLLTEEVLVEEEVPVWFEKRWVKKTVTRWECPEGEDNG